MSTIGTMSTIGARCSGSPVPIRVKVRWIMEGSVVGAEPPAPAQVSVWVTLFSPRGASGFSPSARARPSASS
jgi:hypothetical protein